MLNNRHDPVLEHNKTLIENFNL